MRADADTALCASAPRRTFRPAPSARIPLVCFCLILFALTPLRADQEATGLCIEGEGIEVDRSEFISRLRERGGLNGPAFQDAGRRLEFAQEILSSELLVKEAMESGIDEFPEVRAAIEQALVRRLLIERIDRVIEQAPPTEEDLKSWYVRHQAAYAIEERWRPMIFEARFGSEEEKAEARKRAEWVLDQVRDAKDKTTTFGKLARAWSQHDSAGRGGDLNWVDARTAERGVPSAAVEALKSLTEPGRTSDIIEHDQSFYLLCVSSHRPQSVRPFEQCREEIRAEVYRERRNEAYESLIAGLKIKYDAKIHERTIRNLEIPTPEPVQGNGPPGFPVE